MKRMAKFTTLGRPVDLTYPTNLAIVIISALVFAGAVLLNWWFQTPLIQAIVKGFVTSLTVFLTWALTREIDPDYDLSAFVAVGLMIVLLFVLAAPFSLMVLFWALLILRLVNRTTGLPFRPLDTLIVFGLSLGLTWTGNWGYGLIAALALALDGILGSSFRRHLYAAGAMLLGTAVLFSLTGQLKADGQLVPLWAMIIMAIISLLFIYVIYDSRHVRSVSDLTGEKLESKRIQSAQIIALIGGIQLVWWAGAAALGTSAPLWAVIVGATLYRFIVMWR